MKNKILRGFLFCALGILIFFTSSFQALANDGFVNYKIKSGDTLYGIASKYGLTVDLIKVVNDLPAYAPLKAGDVLLLPKDPEIQVTVGKGDTIWDIAARNDIAPDLLISYNFLKNPDKLKVGQKINIPIMDLKEEPEPIAVVMADNNMDYAVRTMAKNNYKYSSRKMNYKWTMPVVGRVSSDYGKRHSGFHHGIDLACPKGTKINAALDGKVIFAGYKNRIYGNYVAIEHSNGYRTNYAHLSRIYVGKGDIIKAGSVIGRVGETGNATGPHLHFEVFKNGKVQNPNNYLDFKRR